MFPDLLRQIVALTHNNSVSKNVIYTTLPPVNTLTEGCTKAKATDTAFL